jgi:nucleoid DNA-binding protein
MNKANMIVALAQKENLTTKDAAEVINTILAEILKQVRESL